MLSREYNVKSVANDIFGFGDIRRRPGDIAVNGVVSRAFAIPRETLFEYALQITDAIDALQTEARE